MLGRPTTWGKFQQILQIDWHHIILYKYWHKYISGFKVYFTKYCIVPNGVPNKSPTTSKSVKTLIWNAPKNWHYQVKSRNNSNLGMLGISRGKKSTCFCAQTVKTLACFWNLVFIRVVLFCLFIFVFVCFTILFFNSFIWLLPLKNELLWLYN